MSKQIILYNTAPLADIKKYNQTISEIFFKLKNDNEFKNAQDIILLNSLQQNRFLHQYLIIRPLYLITSRLISTIEAWIHL